MNALRTYWQGLADRDQRILKIGAVIVTVMLAWLLIWEPVRTARDAARVRAVAANEDMALMSAAAEQLKSLGSGTERVRDSRSLLALVDATARESTAGEGLLRVEPVTAQQVRVYFEAAGFDALMTWLDTLERKYGINTQDFSIQRAAGVGRVDARVLLERTGE